MSLQIGPDLGDTTVISTQGVNWRISYWFKDDDFNGGVKTFFQAEFPRDFQEIAADAGELETSLMQLAMTVARRKGIHS